MSRFTPKVVTANDLAEGCVVYLTPEGRWSPWLREAAFLETPEEAEARLAEALAQPQTVVGPYLADARRGPSGPEPTHFRESFRATGPTNYPHVAEARSASGLAAE